LTPGIEDAERLQGFTAGWTEAGASGSRGVGLRWKLVGNAVTTGVAHWVGERLASPGHYDASQDPPLALGRPWPSAAWGGGGEVYVSHASPWPRHEPYQHLSNLVDFTQARPLSHRGAAGFLGRTARAKLRFVEEFILDVKEHVELTAA
jgi:DNA (cytosine-5)-methyltransferase 1